MVEGLAAVEARIAEIRSLFVQPPRVDPTRSSPASQATTGTTAATPSFASLLTRATGSEALTPATQKAPGQYGSMQVPAELQRYGNGRIPETALAPVGVGDHRLERNASAAFVRMRADATAAGVNIGIEDSYRTYDEQVDLARRKGLYSQGGLAAAPGSSNHGWGLAVDVDVDDRGQQWLRENGHRYGFVEDVPREPWHWTYRPATPAG